MNVRDKMFWLATFIASISVFWGMIIDYIGGKIWLIGYWLMFIGWLLAILKSKQKMKWGLWLWSFQVFMCLIAFISNIDRAIAFTLWSLKGFAP